MKVFTTAQVRELDLQTIEKEPVTSIDLMERAADALLEGIIGLYPFTSTSFCVIAGPGNNGGDALALSRKLIEAGYLLQVHLYAESKLSPDCNENLQRLLQLSPDSVSVYESDFVLPVLNKEDVIIDGLFGSGLSRPLTGIFADLVDYVNLLPNEVVALDIPSGLAGDCYHRMTDKTIKADYTLSLEFPKQAFFFAENETYVGKWSVHEIGLDPESVAATPTNIFFQSRGDMLPLLKKRARFSHKGTYGHLAILAGSKGMAGASILACKAALRAGVGLLTLHGPEGNRCILQTIAPEVIYDADKHPDCITEFFHSHHYDALAIGPGMGTRTHTVEMLRLLLQQLKEPCVIDADALNILAANRSMLRFIPARSILTPHPKEFERLFGETHNSCETIAKAIEKAAELNIIIVLKGAYTKIITPEGNVCFNSSGNPGMATAGTGDVLTGILGALLAQGYDPEAAARLGVYLHGLAADFALEKESEESMMAGDIIRNLGQAFKYLQ